MKKQISLLLLATCALPACSMMTHQGRQEAAYRRYVHKMSTARVRQQKIFRSSNRPAMPVSEPAETIEASGPVAMTDGGQSN